jgi:hypothetical protein
MKSDWMPGWHPKRQDAVFGASHQRKGPVRFTLRYVLLSYLKKEKNHLIFPLRVP